MPVDSTRLFRNGQGGTGAPSQVRVSWVEDNPEHARRYDENLALDPRLLSLGGFADTSTARLGLPALKPDVVLLDLDLPDGNGIDLLRELRGRCPDCCWMVVSVFGGERNLMRAIEQGATGYLLKDSLPQNFNESILSLHRGESPISPALAGLLLRAFAPQPSPTVPAEASKDLLTGRERDVLVAVSTGLTMVELADKLNISPLTAKTHIQNIYRKLEVRTRQQALNRARTLGVL